MLRYILLDIRLFRDGMNRLDRKGLLAFLEALTCWDEIYLEQNPNTPPLYQSGVVYAIPEQFQKGVLPSPEKIYAALRGVGVPDHLAEKHTDVMVSGENFRDIQALYENKRGDCDNVGCVRAAELRSCGLDASPFITYKKRTDGGTTVHVVTRYPDNTVEDPSRILGMGGYRHKAERDEELRRLAERREIYGKKLAEMQANGREFSPEEIAKIERLVKYLQPPPADFDPVAVGLQFDRKNMR